MLEYILVTLAAFWIEPSKTIKAGVHGVPGGENMMRNAKGDVRYFTMRETARLQTFPDEFIFPFSWSTSARQLGNAVPIDLAEVLGKSIFEALKQAKDNSSNMF